MTEGAAAIAGGRVVAAECAMPALQIALDGGTVGSSNGRRDRAAYL